MIYCIMMLILLFLVLLSFYVNKEINDFFCVNKIVFGSFVDVQFIY